MHWGHFVSDDFVKWEELPEGLSGMDFRDPKIWKEGNNFTIEEITKGANISKGSFYSLCNLNESQENIEF